MLFLTSSFSKSWSKHKLRYTRLKNVVKFQIWKKWLIVWQYVNFSTLIWQTAEQRNGYLWCITCFSHREQRSWPFSWCFAGVTIVAFLLFACLVQVFPFYLSALLCNCADIDLFRCESGWQWRLCPNRRACALKGLKFIEMLLTVFYFEMTMENSWVILYVPDDFSSVFSCRILRLTYEDTLYL